MKESDARWSRNSGYIRKSCNFVFSVPSDLKTGLPLLLSLAVFNMVDIYKNIKNRDFFSENL